MKQEEITIAGKSVVLAYCYATEIAFAELSTGNIHTFVQEAVEAVSHGQMPDVKQTIYLILAAMMAYYNANNQELPVSDSDIMNEAKPTELGTALGTLLNLRAQFYALPAGEPEQQGKGKKKKNS